MCESKDNIMDAINAAKKIKKECDADNSDWTYRPGTEALKINPDILSYVAQGVRTVMVTGTNGKTTTTKMISAMLAAAGIDNTSNRIGTNMTSGLTTTLCLNIDDNGNPKRKYAVLECDEAYSMECAPKIKPEVFVITNIYNGHFARFHGEENCAKKILKAMSDTPPSICCIYEKCHFRDMFTALPGWKFIYFDAEGDTAIVDGERFNISLSMGGEFNLKNAAAAIAAVKAMGFLNDDSLKALADVKPAFGRMERIQNSDLDITMRMVKYNVGWEAFLDELSKNDDLSIPHLYLSLKDNDSNLEDGGYELDNDYRPLFKHFEKIHITSEYANRLKELMNKQVPDSDGRVDVMDYNDVVKTIVNDKQKCYVVGDYFGTLDIYWALQNKGAVRSSWDYEY